MDAGVCEAHLYDVIVGLVGAERCAAVHTSFASRRGIAATEG